MYKLSGLGSQNSLYVQRSFIVKVLALPENFVMLFRGIFGGNGTDLLM